MLNREAFKKRDDSKGRRGSFHGIRTMTQSKFDSFRGVKDKSAGYGNEPARN